ncbi:hypothetical protein MVES1_001308 [Malassezia vespertilionis]|uniref:GDP/GTP exchange factor Sec2 N-terminal domain-containing protein n=1 Tax=Malassezia vespertilionis TaxID=2020962 RepID=A0A2N1JEX8_9BASI|nr:uncharacterized protein MVES1_001308 [Malassezia vespertilionis]PKI85090.1 hypothetical protein MVES_001228 [Malassezia vespertilionis]WFD05970.1 hypothetical protein MVES1_001308 [Malassezia vespertilionis]
MGRAKGQKGKANKAEAIDARPDEDVAVADGTRAASPSLDAAAPAIASEDAPPSDPGPAPLEGAAFAADTDPTDEALLPAVYDAVLDGVPTSQNLQSPVKHRSTARFLENLSPTERVHDLQNQVVGLNAKLVTSYNRISDLEDALSLAHSHILKHTTHIAELSKEREHHLFALNTGLLVEKAHVTSEMQRMMDRVVDETQQRGKAESDKTRIEAELEELSASLFNEANKMVAVERLARAKAESKCDQVEESLRDTERIMAEQQIMLKNLQAEVQSICPGGEQHVAMNALTLSDSMSTQHTELQPILNHAYSVNILPFYEFIAFVDYLRAQHSQVSQYHAMHRNGSDWTLDPSAVPHLGVSLGGVVTPSLTGHAGVVRHRDYPYLPSTAEQLVQLSSQTSLPFVRRAQEEDSDPCIRLSQAPGLNWLSRRQTGNAVLDGSLVIEPLFAGGNVVDAERLYQEYGHLPPATCALCGTDMLDIGALLPGAQPLPEQDMQRSSSGRRSLPSFFHSFRRSVASADRSSLSIPMGHASESDEDLSRAGSPRTAANKLPIPTHYFCISGHASNKYMICPHYCLQRLRAACGFWSFIRTLERTIVLEGKMRPDVVGATRIVRAKVLMGLEDEGPMGERPDGIVDAEQIEAGVEAAHKAEAAAERARAAEDAEQEDVFEDAEEEEKKRKEGEEALGAEDNSLDTEAAAAEAADAHGAENAQQETVSAQDTVSPADKAHAAPLDKPPPLPKRETPMLPPQPPHASKTAPPSLHAQERDLEWEENLWKEVMHLKEAMWKARVGLQHIAA